MCKRQVVFLKALDQAKIISKSVILFWLLNMAIWSKNKIKSPIFLILAWLSPFKFKLCYM